MDDQSCSFHVCVENHDWKKRVLSEPAIWGCRVVSSPGTLCRSYLRLQYNQLAGHNECNKRLTLIRLISMFYTVEASSQ
jgi:hypothetical protein